VSTKAQAVVESFYSLPKPEQLVVYVAIARTVVPGNYRPLSDEDLTAIAAETFSSLDEEEQGSKPR